MSPKLALSALVGALSLSACYVVPYGSYGYYPAYPTYPGTPVVGTAQTQQEIPVEPAGAPNSGYVQQNYQGADDTPTSAYASTTQPTQQYAAGPPVVYAPYPAYYPSYPVYTPYPAYYGGYGYPAYGYGSSLSVGFGWYGGGGRGHYYRH